VARSLLDASERPPVGEVTARPAARGRRGYGAYLGTVPAFGGPPVRGVRIQGVRRASPAERAGLRGGDVIVEFEGTELANLEDLAAVLRQARSGQEVQIVVVRDGERVHTTATLGTRR
jgi:S1-C subfamily serine protease